MLDGTFYARHFARRLAWRHILLTRIDDARVDIVIIDYDVTFDLTNNVALQLILNLSVIFLQFLLIVFLIKKKCY